MKKNILVILAAGIGSRFGSEIPKQYTLLNGEKVIDICVREMRRSKQADKIVLVIDDLTRQEECDSIQGVDIIQGGNNRAQSFQNAMDFINEKYSSCEKVVFHEAARPLLMFDVIDRYFELLDEYDYVETCQKITDSLGSYTIKAPNRDDYYLIQAPEAYRFGVLNEYFNVESPIYFAANQFPDICKGIKIFDVMNNYKLTTMEDRVLIEAILKSRNEECKKL